MAKSKVKIFKIEFLFWFFYGDKSIDNAKFITLTIHESQLYLQFIHPLSRKTQELKPQGFLHYSSPKIQITLMLFSTSFFKIN